MQTLETLEFGNYYHIYNCGINGCNLFEDEANFQYFLSLYEKYMDTLAETFAWVLMPNYFHLLVKLRERHQADEKPPHQHFSNLFNAYTKAFNKYHHRHGALFERPNRRKLITHEAYFQQLVVYIHHNPVHHGFCSHPLEYGWSSYLSCISKKPTKLKRDKVIKWFANKKQFIHLHNEKPNIQGITGWLGL